MISIYATKLESRIPFKALLLYLLSLVTITVMLVFPGVVAAQEKNKPASEKEWMVPAQDVLEAGNMLVVQPVLQNNEYDDFVEIYEYQGSYFLPLGTLTQLLELAIDVKPAEGKADGWILKQSRGFHLDIVQGYIIVNNKKAALPPQKITTNNSDIFIESSLFASWFPLAFKINKSTLTLTITPSEKLPIELKQEREKKWNKLHRNEKKESRYPLKEVPYEAFGWPALDISAGYNYTNPAPNKNQYNYSVIAGGDVAYLNTQLFASGTTDEPLSNVRMAAGRKDNEGNLLGVLKATQFSIGDINSTDIPLAASSGQGRGFMVSNRALSRSSQFDTTHFQGDAIPEWDVELYRNGSLLEFQHIPENGRYEFLNVPILYGQNTFRLVFYGPQGQIREEVKRFSANDNLLQKGSFTYSFSANQQSQPLFPTQENNTSLPSDTNSSYITSNVVGERVVGNVEYGLFRNTTATFGVAHVPLSDQQHDYSTAGLKIALPGGIFSSYDIAYDTTGGGWAGAIAALTSLNDVNLQAGYKKFSNFTSEEQLVGSSGGLKSSSEGAIDTPIPFAKNINIGASVKQDVFNTNNIRTEYMNRISTSIGRINFTNKVGIVENRSLGNKIKNVQGELATNGTIKTVSLRAVANYIVPDSTFSNIDISGVNISAQKQLKENIAGVMGVTKGLLENQQTTVSLSLNWSLKKAKLGFGVSADDQRNFYAGTNVSFSLAEEPTSKKWYMQKDSSAGTGAVTASAFLDKNYNGAKDLGEESVPKTAFKVGNRRIESDKNAIAFTSGIAPDRPVNITLDENSLEDPSWVSNQNGYSLTSRAGVVNTLHFPIVIASEIEGCVMTETVDGPLPLSRVIIELVDKDNIVKQTTKTEFDGFYFLEKVMPGEYTLRISLEQQKKLHIETAIETYKIVVSGTGEVFQGKNFTIRKI